MINLHLQNAEEQDDFQVPTVALKRRDKEQEKLNEMLRKKEILKALEEPLTEEQ